MFLYVYSLFGSLVDLVFFLLYLHFNFSGFLDFNYFYVLSCLDGFGGMGSLLVFGHILGFLMICMVMEVLWFSILDIFVQLLFFIFNEF